MLGGRGSDGIGTEDAPMTMRFESPPGQRWRSRCSKVISAVPGDGPASRSKELLTRHPEACRNRLAWALAINSAAGLWRNVTNELGNGGGLGANCALVRRGTAEESYVDSCCLLQFRSNGLPYPLRAMGSPDVETPSGFSIKWRTQARKW